jgi:ribosomal protein S18 acetylase RimI-like enzyme
MKLTMRPYQTDEDYWRIRTFLREVFLLNDWREFSWQAYRFDYWRWHGIENMGHGRLETDVFLWETPDGELAAVLNRESPGSVFLQVHPVFRSVDLENEMLDVAEKHLTVADSESGESLRVWADENDPVRIDLLKQRGYAQTGQVDYQRRRDLSEPIPDITDPAGYTVRSLGGVDEHPARSWLSWRAFHPDATQEEYEGWQWYANIQRAPLYRRDLDLIAVSDDGELAAFSTIWFDDVTRTGAFEPVGTSPEHQRRGLASAVMREGLRRLQRLGADLAFVGSWNEATHRLYGSLGFDRYDISSAWRKRV